MKKNGVYFFTAQAANSPRFIYVQGHAENESIRDGWNRQSNVRGRTTIYPTNQITRHKFRPRAR